MKLHRFYVSPEIELRHDLWIHDERLIHQWSRVLRFKPGQEIVLFDSLTHDRLYKIDSLDDKQVHLLHITDLERQTPKKNIYLLWSLLKKDKNDWVLQKATELGVIHFLPLLAARCERTDLSQTRKERWEKIVIEAAEQCGRSDIPNVRDPIRIETAINELKDKITLLVCEQSNMQDTKYEPLDSAGILIGPEGGWTDSEKELFKEQGLPHLNLHDFTLRAETAALAAVTKLLQ